MNRKRQCCSVLLLFLIVALTGCDKLAALQNNKSRIAGDWFMVENGFKRDEMFSFDEGMIERDGIGWGSYKFKQNAVIEVSIDDGVKGSIYQLDFPDDDTMFWYQMAGDKRINRFEWKR